MLKHVHGGTQCLHSVCLFGSKIHLEKSLPVILNSTFTMRTDVK